jgi:hypothetical protein
VTLPKRAKIPTLRSGKSTRRSTSLHYPFPLHPESTSFAYDLPPDSPVASTSFADRELAEEELVTVQQLILDDSSEDASAEDNAEDSYYEPQELENLPAPNQPLIDPITIIPAMAAIPMPAKNHSSAPSFNPNKPRELPSYFEELEILLDAAQIVDDQSKKEQAKRYVPREDADLWVSLAEYAAGSSYEDFKAAVLRLYPGADDERKYSRHEVDRFVADRQRLGIASLEELASFY